MIRRVAFASSALLILVSNASTLRAGGELSSTRVDSGTGIAWFDLKQFDLEGKGWTDTKAFYDRLPAKAESTVRPEVWNLSQQSAGLCTRFITDATAIHAAWSLTSHNLAMAHMPATGVSGVDLYVKQNDGTWRWLAIGFPAAMSNTLELVKGIPAGRREYLLYLPLYNGVNSVEIGVPTGSKIEKADARGPGERKPVVFYGTSITQGGCASRPGMVHTAIVGRRLNYPVINLGFSGNGRMEAEVAQLMAELDPSVFVIDCLPNIDAKLVSERTAPLVKILRAAHPETPILLVEDRSYTNSFLLETSKQRNESSRAALKTVFEQLKTAGDKQLYYLEGADLLGADGEDTVDSSHPTDLGFLRQANAFERALRPILHLE